jgi:hypothetical protein
MLKGVFWTYSAFYNHTGEAIIVSFLLIFVTFHEVLTSSTSCIAGLGLQTINYDFVKQHTSFSQLLNFREVRMIREIILLPRQLQLRII